MDKIEVTAEQIKTLLAEGKSKTEIGEQFGISATKVGLILKEADKAATKVEPTKEVPASTFAVTYAETEVNDNSKVVILTASEYEKYSKANGRVMGRKKGVKTVCSIEELRALVNSGWTPSMVMEKHGMTEDDFKQLVWKLSKSELRDRPLKFSFEKDFIEKG